MAWFLSRNDRNYEEEISLSSMKKKEKSKEFVYSIRERIIKRHVKSFTSRQLKDRCYWNLEYSYIELCQD